MKTVGTIFLLASTAMGLFAAWLWWQASKPVGDPYFGHGQSGDTSLNDALISTANTASINESAARNKFAALWTGLSVAAGAIGNILSALAS